MTFVCYGTLHMYTYLQSNPTPENTLVQNIQTHTEALAGLDKHTDS